MKKTAVGGLLIVITLASVLLYWQQVRIAKFDRDFHRQLAGTWMRRENGMGCINIVAADGSFVEQSWFIHPNRTNIYQRTGSWLVKSGCLIETIKTSTNPTEVTPHTGAARIVCADANGFTMRWQNATETVWQRLFP
jgi:hypothetical protein